MFFQGEHHLLHLLHGTGHNGSLESLVVGDPESGDKYRIYTGGDENGDSVIPL